MNVPDNREMQGLLAKLEAKSSYQRKRVNKYQETLGADDETFSLHRLTSHDDLLLKQTCEFLSGVFEQGMDDEDKIMNQWIFDFDIAYHALTDKEGKVIAAANSSYMPLENSESILAVWYVAVAEEYRGKRLANELYQSIYQFAEDRAQDYHTKVKAIVGEASHQEIQTIEQVLRREEISRKRAYYYDQSGIIKEVPYVSPPLKWDSETGAPAEEAQPNHLMLKLLQIITAIYRDSYSPREEDFMNKEYHDRAVAVVDGHLRTIETALAEASNGKVFLK